MWIGLYGFYGFRPSSHTWRRLIEVGQAWIHADEQDDNFPGLLIFEFHTNELYEATAQEEYPYFAFRTFHHAEIRILADSKCMINIFFVCL